MNKKPKGLHVKNVKGNGMCLSPAIISAFSKPYCKCDTCKLFREALASSEANFQKERDQIGQILTELVWEIEYLEQHADVIAAQAKELKRQDKEIASLKKENHALKHVNKTINQSREQALSELRDEFKEVKFQSKKDQQETIADCKKRNDKEGLSYQRAYFHGYLGCLNRVLKAIDSKIPFFQDEHAKNGLLTPKKTGKE